ncbi:MAG TPA: hypothetical protein DCX53_09870 [Anaerolineae bacterium]|nr:hypothetical protein [Anaerolineae bacterium]
MKITGKQYLILLGGLATALLHLSLFPRMGPDPIALNGLGYLALLGAYFLPISFFQQKHNLVWWALTGYTVLTFVLWIVMGDKTFVLDFSNAAIGYYAKASEIILLIGLWSDKPKS